MRTQLGHKFAISPRTMAIACGVVALVAVVSVAKSISRPRFVPEAEALTNRPEHKRGLLTGGRSAAASRGLKEGMTLSRGIWTNDRVPLAVAGRVLTAEGAPVVGANISFQGASGNEHVVTDQEGVFVLARSEWPQDIACFPPIGWRVVPRQITLHEPPAGEVLFVASEVGTSPIGGVVLDRDTGEGVPFFQLTVAGWTSTECLSGSAVSSDYDIELLGELVETDRNGYFETSCLFHREGRRVRIWPHDDVRIRRRGNSPVFSASRVPSMTEPLYVDVGPVCRLSLRGHDVNALQLRALLLPDGEAIGEVPYMDALVPVRLNDDWPWVRFPSEGATLREGLRILLISAGSDQVIGVSGKFDATKTSWAMVDVLLSGAATLTVDLQGARGALKNARVFLDAPEDRPAAVRVLPLGADGRIAFGPVVPGRRVLRVCDEEREVHRADLFLIGGEHLVHMPPFLKGH